LEYIGLLEYGLKFGDNCLPPKKRNSKTATEKNVCKFFFTITKINFQLFLLVSLAEFLEVYDKKKKKSKTIFEQFKRWRNAHWFCVGYTSCTDCKISFKEQTWIRFFHASKKLQKEVKNTEEIDWKQGTREI
jgi:hypothetical protein